jgi:hypothetical protein
MWNGASSYSERERERERDEEKRQGKEGYMGHKAWLLGLVAARAAEATAGGRDGELDCFLRVVALQIRAGP